MEKPVTFKNNGEQIIGVLHSPDQQGTFPGILFCHGFGGVKSESHFLFTKLARQLCSERYNVLRFDFRGSGDSEGKFEDMTPDGQISDAERALRFLKSKKKVNEKKIGILGFSMGAVSAVCLAAKHREIKYLALWSPVAYSSLLEEKILTSKIKKKIEETGKAYVNGHYLGKMFIENARRINLLECAENFTGKVLISASEDDQTVPVEHAYAYFRSFHVKTSSCHMLIMDKGGHAFVSEYAETSVLEETCGFFGQFG